MKMKPSIITHLLDSQSQKNVTNINEVLRELQFANNKISSLNDKIQELELRVQKLSFITTLVDPPKDVTLEELVKPDTLVHIIANEVNDRVERARNLILLNNKMITQPFCKLRSRTLYYEGQMLSFHSQPFNNNSCPLSSKPRSHCIPLETSTHISSFNPKIDSDQPR
uniref:Uncharacterized protein n=1 Tax=Oryzias sinensis TaxID=183150 RepID=A0A8C8DT45_9TELE